VSGRVLIAPFGTTGDVHPLVAVGAALRERGVEVLFVVWERFRRTVERAGLPCETIEREMTWDRVVAEARGHALGVRGATPASERWFWQTERRAVETLPIARAFAPDAVLGNAVSLHAMVVADALGAPWVCAAMSPRDLLSVDDPPVLGSRWRTDLMPRWRRRLVLWGAVALTSWWFDGPTNRARRACGTRRRFGNYYLRPTRGAATIALFSPALRGPARDDPPGLTFAGFTWHDRSGEFGAGAGGLDAGLERFLDAGEPPVIVSPGTVKAHAAPELFELALDACRRIGRRVVLVTGEPHAGRFDGLPDAHRVDYAPYSALMPRGAMVVHHGGTGTLSWALRARRPMVVTPMAYDQFDHAARLERLGVALAEPLRGATAGALAARMDRVLREPGFAERAAALGAVVGREDGAAAAADRIAAMLPGAGASP
jgi:rhamnosyltransferase subunit B